MMSEFQFNLVLADRGWILERCALEIASRFPGYFVSEGARSDVDLNYYINYSAFRGKKAPVEIAFFTHVEPEPSAAQRFFKVASIVDYQIAMSRRYAKMLSRAGSTKVSVIPPGVDLETFTPRLRIGVVGRTYDSGRKGEDILREVMDMNGIEWRFTGQGWPGESRLYDREDMPEFYNSIDYLLVPSRYEGGPISVLEALASGKEVIASDVGWVRDFPHIRFRNGDAGSLRKVLEALVKKRQKLRHKVENYTWDNWAQRHDTLFRLAVKRSRGMSH
jgi:glycosyltransferase involved in cell wall biosynthesis